MRKLMLGMLITTSMAYGQSYDFTISGQNVSASGIFSTSGQNGSFLPISSLSGTMNGQPLSLMPMSNQVGNMFNLNTMDVEPFYPLFMMSAGHEYVLSHENPHGSAMLNMTPVTFKVTPMLFSTHPILPSNGAQVSFARSLRNRNETLAISISVPATIAVVAWIVEHERHHKRPSALPAGRY